ncbi:MAG: uroporphyrinogen-III synthase, partial [Longimicrobiales bacterium]|nr:uroporphyrinogen-III synthase [Longimicrobiales bacterium]
MSPPSALAGHHIVVTRDEEADGPVSARLTARGATPILRPAVRFDFAPARAALGEAAREMASFDWLVVTSRRAVRALEGAGAFARARPEGLRAAAVGPGTAAELDAHGWTAEIAAESGGAEALVERLLPALERGERVLFPASAAARETLPTALRDAGARVTRIDAYAPRPAPQSAPAWSRDLDAGRLDALTFTSPSAVEALTTALTAVLSAPDLAALHALPA